MEQEFAVEIGGEEAVYGCDCEGYVHFQMYVIKLQIILTKCKQLIPRRRNNIRVF